MSERTEARRRLNGEMGIFGMLFLLGGLAGCVWALVAPVAPEQSNTVNLQLTNAKIVWAAVSAGLMTTGAVLVGAQAIVSQLLD